MNEEGWTSGLPLSPSPIVQTGARMGIDTKIVLTGDPPVGQTVVFKNLERPHADELTLFT